ncbi:MAG: hypothetical protein DRP37_05390 [Thermodesulfobacteriota bacterium]|nr:MAG: hypothetical protein DRP37_05390 [Thermodesulfobacteriota bacterium]
MKHFFAPYRTVIFVLSLTLISFGGLSTFAYGESAADLKLQMKTMQDQMMQMQENMQTLQNRINQLETAPPAPQVAAQQATDVPSLTAEEITALRSLKDLGNVWSKYNMQLYGKVKVDFNYDTAEFTRYNDFVGAVAQESDYKNDSTNFNPRDTRIGFTASHKWGEWSALGRVEMDFYGDNNGDNLIPRMRHGYIDIGYEKTHTSMVVGQDWVPVSQLNPSTIDFGIMTAAGNLWWRVPQVTVRQEFGDVQVLASVMKHRRTSTENEDRMPWLLGRVQYSNEILGKGGLVALGGGYRHADYGQDSSNNTDRWLVCGELKYVAGSFTFKGELWTGEGIGRNFLRYDLDMAEDGGPASAYGGWADLTYAVNDKTTMTAGYGFDNPNNGDIGNLTDTNDRRFTRNEQYFINTWYSLTKPLKVGAEYIYIETERHEQIHSGNRFTVSMQYAF